MIWLNFDVPGPLYNITNLLHLHHDILFQIKGMAKFYPKVYCTETMIEPFLLYLPFTLLLVPIVLTGIEKTYVM